MSYSVRNLNREDLRQQAQQQQQQHRDLQQQQQQVGAAGGQYLEWTFLNNGRVSNSNSEDSSPSSSSTTSELVEDENGNLSLVQKDEAAFMSLASSNEPVVTHSTRMPHYPIEYSCEHTLLYPSNNNNKSGHDAVDDAAMMSHSEDDEDNADDEKEEIVLNDTRVRMSLEFEIPTTVPDNYEEVTSNVEALQWSILNKIASRSGLSKDCKVDVQYDERTLLTAFTTMNDLHTSTHASSHESDSSSPNNNTSHSDGQKNRRLRRRQESQSTLHRSSISSSSSTSRSLLSISSLPYPTSVYSIGSNRPKWIASCSSEIMGYKKTTSQCFTTEISLDIKYRGSTGESNLIEEFIQSIVHNQVALDATQLFAEDITGLKWISNDEASTVFDESKSDQGISTPVFFGPDDTVDDSPQERDGMTESNTSMTSTKDTSNAGFASVVIPLATAIILFAIWYCTHKHYIKKRKNRRSQRHHKQKSLLGLNSPRQRQDIETGSVSTETSQATRDFLSKNSSASSDDGNDPQAIGSSTYVMSATAPRTSAVASSPASSTASKRSTKSIPISVDSPERSAAGLPPRPLVVKREVSKQLKKQRKKKKKKKKKVLALKRINSREHIDELPMISESESECDSEYTSGDEDDEHYQDDDGSSYDASVGCLTPTRSSSQRSRTSSRASSPQVSPRDELFPSEPMDSSDFEFVIEAPEFSKDLFAEDSAKEDNRADGGRDLPPKLSLQPKIKKTKTDKDKVNKELPVGNEEQKTSEEAATVDKKECGTLEIETRTELDTSFSKENGSVMERMLPLPWLTKSSNGRKK